MLCYAPENIAGEEYQRRETVARETQAGPSSFNINVMCASYVYKRRKPPNSVTNSSQVNVPQVNRAQVNSTPSQDPGLVNAPRSQVNFTPAQDSGSVNVPRAQVNSTSTQDLGPTNVPGAQVDSTPAPDLGLVNALGPQVNGQPEVVAPPSTSVEKDCLRIKLPACRNQRLTLLGNGPVDFTSSSSPDHCSSSSSCGVHLLLGSLSYSSFHMACKKCGVKGNPLRMLICDLCDEAFHFSCCKARKVPENEWYCRPCLRKKPRVLPETLSEQLFYIMKQKKKRKIMRDKLGPIMSMLVDGSSYTSGVRIGKRYQAEVPEWAGPVSDGDDYMGKVSELGPDERWSLNTTSLGRLGAHSIGNWIQCRAMVYNEADENDEGTLCGKWRRAPTFATQTEDWDCSCALTWDPVHADCAVPQELETSQVLQQLKCIQLLKRRLVANRGDKE